MPDIVCGSSFYLIANFVNLVECGQSSLCNTHRDPEKLWNFFNSLFLNRKVLICRNESKIIIIVTQTRVVNNTGRRSGVTSAGMVISSALPGTCE